MPANALCTLLVCVLVVVVPVCAWAGADDNIVCDRDGKDAALAAYEAGGFSWFLSTYSELKEAGMCWVSQHEFEAFEILPPVVRDEDAMYSLGATLDGERVYVLRRYVRTEGAP